MKSRSVFVEILAWICAFFVALAIVFAFGFLIEGSDFVLYRIFAPARADVDRQVFENTRSFREGQALLLRKEQAEYIAAPAADKPRIAAVILNQVAGVNLTSLPPDLADFVSYLRNQGFQQ